MSEETENQRGRRLPPASCSEFIPRAGSLWLVVVECRYNVVAVCSSGYGFYIPGQEPCWHFSHVAEWIAEIDPDNYQAATNSSESGSLQNDEMRNRHLEQAPPEKGTAQ